MTIAVLAALVVAPVARGTLVVPQTIEELSKKSDAIVRGTVKDQESRWSPDHHLITTFVRIKVDEALKGGPSGEIVVQRSGGGVGTIGQRVEGEPEFTTGEHVVLFLARLPASAPMYRVNGMAQGKLTLRIDSSGAVRAEQDTRTLSFSRDGQMTPGGFTSMPLKDLVARIKLAAGNP